MNNLREAYAVLQLQQGSSLDLINKQYKWLAMSCHPDKFRTTESKATAERELKKINHARDVLRSHFQSDEHRAGGRCDCEKPVLATAEPDCETQARTSTFHTANAFQSSQKTNEKRDTLERPFHNEFRDMLKEQEADVVGRWRVSKLCAAVFAILLLSAGFSDVAIEVTKVARESTVGLTRFIPRI